MLPPALNVDEAADAWRDVVEAGLRYWGRLGRLAFESLTALARDVAEQRPAAADRVEERRSSPTILVEAEAGESGLGVFLIENTTADQLSIPVTVSSFVDDAGREVHPVVAFRPDVLSLDPGDQFVVQVAAAVDESLEPDVRYHAEITIPGLSETRIPIVVRRRPSAAPRRSKGRTGTKTART